jgi:STE24 endopeptidase
VGITLNLFGIVILSALIIDYALGILADTLNLRQLSGQAPPSLKGIYDEEEYRRSQEYTRASTRFGFVTASVNLVVVLAFWFAGGFNALDVIIRGWGFSELVNGLAYIGLLLLAYSVVSLPFAIYHTFVIEQRFGFNRTTPALFVTDRLKGLGLALILGIPLLSGVILLFQGAGHLAWIYAWAAVVAVSLVIQYVAPTWILPLFNKFSPMPDGELRKAIMEYARAQNFPIANLYVVDSSKRSTRANAYFTGLGKNKRIALFDTLVQQHSIAELVGILAHEIGHYKKKHILKGLIISVVHMGIVFFSLSLVLQSPGIYEAFRMGKQSVYAGLLFFGLLYTPLELVLSIAMNIMSRANEREADAYAAATADGESLVSALKKLSKNNLSNLNPHPFYVFLNYSHPPLLERTLAIERRSSATGGRDQRTTVHGR